MGLPMPVRSELTRPKPWSTEMSQVAPGVPPRWTLAALRRLPPTIPAQMADAILGIAFSTGKRLRAAGTYPVPVLSLGRHHRVPAAPLLRLLGVPAGDVSGVDGSMPVHFADGAGPIEEEGAA